MVEYCKKYCNTIAILTWKIVLQSVLQYFFHEVLLLLLLLLLQYLFASIANNPAVDKFLQ